MKENKYIYSIFMNYLISGKYYTKKKSKINEDLINYVKEKCILKEVVYNASYLSKLLIAGNSTDVLNTLNSFFEKIYEELGKEYKSCVKITFIEALDLEPNIQEKDNKSPNKNDTNNKEFTDKEIDDLTNNDKPIEVVDTNKDKDKEDNADEDKVDEDEVDADEESEDKEENNVFSVDHENDDFEDDFGLDDFIDKLSSSKYAKAEDKDEPMRNEKARILERIDKLVGSEEFKKYAKDLLNMGPKIKKSNTLSLFKNLSLIISINEGYGLSTCLEILNDCLVYTGLLDSYSKYPRELVIEPNRDKENQVELFCNQTYSFSKGLVCIDISNHMDKVFTRAFNKLLRNISKLHEKKFIVFRIPFVEKNVLDQVNKAINDILYCKTITIAPFNQEETEQIAKEMLSDHNFTFSEDGLKIFNKKIIEEKNDGRYYGFRTIKKVISEIIYTKLFKSISDDTDSNVIRGKDIEEILLFKDIDELTGLEELDTLIGLDSVKEKVIEITNQIKATIKYQMKTKQCIHMRFVGSPGTGKTTIARIIGKILKENNVLRNGNFYEVSGRDLVGKYIGHTAPKTTEICRDAYGSVLFIDEAYTLYRSEDNGRDFGLEAIDTLIAQIENHRDDMVVIFAGYKKEMDLLMTSNPGLASRVPYEIEFPNYSKETLHQILVRMIEKDNIEYDESYLEEAEKFFKQLPDSFIESRSFGNARFVRNIFERSLSKCITRCELAKVNIKLTKEDFIKAKDEKDFEILNVTNKKIKLGFL